ncbi:hypothetical protein Cgig2_013786 [Carnegiea gigantea]|uniref:Elongin-A n=1 Tax=Carnegiea gigantea TaxID=171969 RepID=A0A9Q1JRK4_9CARY|nr:hypothetical protein Cgig2_013786 [Carnegiea gigantea]
MRSGYIHLPARNRQGKGKPPSLVDLCVQVAIDNIRYIGNVGATDAHLLEQILPHCTVEQLMHIENATVDRDLTPVTDKLWKKFFEATFGSHWVEKVVKRMAENGVTYNWRQLYQARLKEVDEKRNNTVERIAQSYKDQNARESSCFLIDMMSIMICRKWGSVLLLSAGKQSRQIQICTKVPPSTKKRSFCGGKISL